ncbi:MAG: diacylglycerol kinase family lipid kinase [Eubacteriaceae bacterium]|nr:diacylglycerol kinase family lipid kinase [Eubacteriaceae bacterium]
MDKKKVLIIMNPYAGRKQANRHLAGILEIFCEAGYINTVMMTGYAGHGVELTRDYAPLHDMVVAIGGDGTLREVVNGLSQAKADIPVGYIPAGSTNDFSRSLLISSDPIMAARDIVAGDQIQIDVGSFNGSRFAYVASFGAFTQSSYETPQAVKNAFGHSAYVASAMKEIGNIKTYHLKVESDETTLEGDYIFGAFSNATSLGGVLKLKSDAVDLSDGKFEVMLVKQVKTLSQLANLASDVANMDYGGSITEFFSAEKVKITASPDMNWSLDGEYCEGCENITIENIPRMLKLIVNNNR